MATLRPIVALLALLSGSCFSAPAYQGPPSHNFDGTRFRNLAPRNLASGNDLFRWLVTREEPEWPDWIDEEPGPPPPDRVEGDELRVTFVGHATALVQTAGINLLTDPVWSHRIGPVSFAGPTRKRPPGIRFEDLPPIDAVWISHNHYDHLDMPSVRRVAEEHGARFFVGLGVDLLFEEEGIAGAEALDWWQSAELAPGVVVHGVPAQHFSGRGMTDLDRTLWMGFVLETPGGNVYYAGDTAFGPHYLRIRERYGRPRLAIMPIGAYQPRWFMTAVHMSPSEAVYASRILGAHYSVPVHFGTFAQGDEDMGDAEADLAAALRWDEPERWWVLDHGRGYGIPGLASARASR